MEEGEERLAAFVARFGHPHAMAAAGRDSDPRASGAYVRRQQPVAKRPAADRSLIGRLTIPRLHLSAMVREGIGENTLRVSATAANPPG
jgi:hypothetical protein